MSGTFPFSVRPDAACLHLRIMATTDLHLQVLDWDHFADAPRPGTGLARATALARQLRREADNALLFDCGDILQGNPLGEFLARAGARGGAPHPMIAAMNAAGYDAATLGNHDFDYGLGFLLEAVAGAHHPVVLANIAHRLGPSPPSDETILPPYTILRRRFRDGAGGLRRLAIGVIGFAPPTLTRWNRQRLGNRLKARDIVEAARGWVPRMRAEGADLVIALCHSGIGSAEEQTGMENAAVPLAAVEGIDVVIAGHQHLVFPPPCPERSPARQRAAAAAAPAGAAGVVADPVDAAAGTLHGKPAVMAGAQGSHLGLIDLLLEQARGQWRVAGHRSLALPVGEPPPEEEAHDVAAAMRPVHEATLARTRRVIGHTRVPLTTHFAPLGHAPSVRLLAGAQLWHLRRRVAGTGWAELPLLSAAAPARAGGRGGPFNYTDIPPGALSLRQLADICPFPNSFCALRLTGAELRGWLERAAALFARVEPGAEGQFLIEPDEPPYELEMIEGLSYEIDLSRAAGEGRIRALRWQGRPVEDAMEFLLATNSYRAAGGGGFPGTGAEPVIAGEETSLQILTRYVEEQGSVAPTLEPLWRFRPLGGTELLFDTGPGALAHLPALQRTDIRPVGPAPGGFLRFRLRV